MELTYNPLHILNLPGRPYKKHILSTRDNPILPNYIFVDCLSPRVKDSVCDDIVAYPILVDNKYSKEIPAMFYKREDGKVVKPKQDKRLKYATVVLPWESKYQGFPIPVGRYGPLMSLCDYYYDTESWELIIKCPGEPDREAMNAVNRVARIVGWGVRWQMRKFYDLSSMITVAERIDELCRRGETIYVSWTPFIHVVFGALEYLSERKKRYIGTCVKLAEVLDLGDKLRNQIKSAIDYMCSQGDEVACLAHNVIHATKYRYFFD